MSRESPLLERGAWLAASGAGWHSAGMSAPAASALPAASARPPGWIRSPRFDMLLILGVLYLAVAAALVAYSSWRLVLLLDLWLLGYHHVIATYTRLIFDRESLRQNLWMVTLLPLVAFGLVVAIGYLCGLRVLMAVYLYWQWFHYTRQSYGVERMYWRKAGESSKPSWPAWGVIYGIPALGISYRAWQGTPGFLGHPVTHPPMPTWLLLGVAGAVGALTLVWLWRRAREWRAGTLHRIHTLYLASHALAFVWGYLGIDNLTHGWLMINVWHNAQYLLIVWHYNQRRFQAGVHPEHRFLSTISQPRHALTYFAVCLLATFALYAALFRVGEGSAWWGVPLVIVLGSTINFHHYLVDGWIWKLRKPRLQTQLGLS